jgi:hypothetical protein
MNDQHDWDAEIDRLDEAADEFGEEAVRSEMAEAVCTRADAVRRLLRRSGADLTDRKPANAPDPLAQSVQTG